MKKIFSKFGVYLLDLIAALLIGFLIQFIVSLVVFPIVEMSQFAARMMKAVFFVMATTVWLFFSARTIGYKNKEIHLASVLTSAILVLAIQQILSPFFHYAEYVSGGALQLTYAVFLKNDPIFAEAPTFLAAGVPQWGYHVIMLIVDIVLYIPAIIAGEHFGVKKRQNDREELIGKK